ncbi:MAG: hypothetical protein AB2811_06855, partial [Candidatus Sedimenticola endophacoides]
MMEAQPIGDRDLNRLSLEGISANGLVVVGDRSYSPYQPPNGKYPDSAKAWARETMGFPLADLDLNDRLSQSWRQAVKWTKVGGVEDIGPKRVLYRPDRVYESTYATAVSDSGDVIVGNAAELFQFRMGTDGGPENPDARMYVERSLYDEGSRESSWREEKNRAFILRGGEVTKLGEGTFAHGISGDGKVVVGGWASPWPTGPNGEAMKLPIPVDWNGDFSRDKFSALREYPAISAMRWTEEGGVELLGDLPGGATVISPNGKRKYASLANDASRDGGVIVGFSATSGHQRAFRWTEAGGMESLGDEAQRNLDRVSRFSVTTSVAEAVSADGRVVVGGLRMDDASPWRAFKWTKANGLMELGVADNLYYINYGQGTKNWRAEESYAYDISGDGKVIVGSTTDQTGIGQKRAFIHSDEVHRLLPRKIPSRKGANWLEDPERYLGGPVLMHTLEDWMRWNGLDEWNKDNDPRLMTRAAYSTNEDGSIVVGELQNGNGFLMYVMPTGGPSGAQAAPVANPGGMVDVSAASVQIGVASAAQKTALDNTQTIIHGAHSRPLSRRVKEGETTFWTTGDAGSGSGKYGNFRIAEVAASHNFGKVQAG